MLPAVLPAEPMNDAAAAHDESDTLAGAARSGAAAASPRIAGCTCFRVRRLARRVTQIYDRTLAPSGLRVTQFSLLTRLVRVDAMPMGALAAELDMDRTTLTRNLKPLLASGLVTLARSPTDARQRDVRLTATGRGRQLEAKRLWRRAQDEINRTLGPSQVGSLHQLFDGLIERLNDAGQSLGATEHR